jgi:two-component system sensor histidine kinase KdpD
VADATLDSLLQTIADRVVQIYGSAGCRILVYQDGHLAVGAGSPPGFHASIGRQAEAMATYALDHRAPAGIGVRDRHIRRPHGTVQFATPMAIPDRDALFLPIATGTEELGVLEVNGRPGGGRFTSDDERLLTSFADQVALAIERTRLTEEATRAAVLEQSDHLKSAMLAAVSHDLRTPLAAIKTSASALLDTSVTWSDEARNDLLAAIEEETDRLALMVSNLLDLSRIEGGALRPDRDWHDLRELIGDVARQMRRRAGARRIEVIVPELLPVASLDYVEIAQVLINLIGNAIIYSDDGSRIVIGVEDRQEELAVFVQDEGVGIAPEHLPHVFESFYRAHGRGPVAGSGIGLAICKGLVEAHGGRIWAESAIGKGTTMWFTLPLEGHAA